MKTTARIVKTNRFYLIVTKLEFIGENPFAVKLVVQVQQP
jgi:hypothetical protein